MALILPDGGELVDLIVPDPQRIDKNKTAQDLPYLDINDYDLQWIHVLSEGWASPLRGFMRESEFLQTLHFNAIRQTDGTWVNQSIPITLDTTEEQKNRLGKSEQIALRFDGQPVAILKDPEFYAHQREERSARTIGLTNVEHPTVERIMAMGEYLVGGELEVLKPVTYDDGLDHYRLSPAALRAEFQKRNADAIYAFQLRNPVHNGHALLMNDTKRKLKAEGFHNPLLLLHPLGGWTKEDDVPLDIRMKQHDAVLADEILDPDTTIVAIFPSPMVYAGPTEVQWHAKARINAGADHYIVGRDPAGMNHPNTGDPIYDPFHGMKVIQSAPGLDRLKIIEFRFAAYDTKAEQMSFFDPSRAGDFLSISGSKMREYARNGESPPKGFMGEQAWKVVADYYDSLPN